MRTFSESQNSTKERQPEIRSSAVTALGVQRSDDVRVPRTRSVGFLLVDPKPGNLVAPEHVETAEEVQS
jgi:hypothetical protein